MDQRMEHMSSEEMKQILRNPATSYWLLRAIDALDQRDPVDAARDADILALYTRKKLEESNEKYIQAVN